MKTFQNKYRIPSTRAPWHGYDGGIYFVTVCTNGMEHYFGTIDDVPQMNLSEIGRYAHEIYSRCNEFYPYAEIPLYVVMPNHIHAVVFIDANDDVLTRRDAINRVSTTGETETSNTGNEIKQPGGITGWHNPMLKKSLGTVMRGLHARITRHANKNGIPFAWQRRFHDRIVRDQDELNRIATYIENNVANWHLDKYYDDRKDE
ncbi:MAG: hypothetical protein WBJ84_11275 [Bacteroidales bacterium]